MVARRKAPEFGQLDAPEDAAMLLSGGLPFEDTDQGDESVLDMSSTPLWSYINEGRINGTPVAAEDCGLKIDSDAILRAAFMLVREPHSLLLYMSPEDTESQTKYDSIISRMYSGDVEIIDEQKQYDPNKGRFIVWLRYDVVHYALHPRFHYLREE